MKGVAWTLSLLMMMSVASLAGAFDISLPETALGKGAVLEAIGQCVPNAIVVLQGIMEDGKSVFSTSEICDENSMYSIRYPISFLDPSGTWELSAFSGQDTATTEVVVTASRESGFLLLSLLSPDRFEIERGSIIPLNVRISDAGIPVEGAKIRTWDLSGNPLSLTEAGDGLYTVDIYIPPSASEGIWDLRIVASTESSEYGNIGGEKATPITILPTDFEVEILSPTGSNFDIGFPIDIVIRAHYPDGTPLQEPAFSLFSGDQPTGIPFLQNPDDPVLFTAQYSPSVDDLGQHSLSIEITDSAGNRGMYIREIIVSEDPISALLRNALFILIFLVLLATLVFFLVFKPYLHLSRRDSLVKEQAHLEEVIKKLQMDYFEHSLIDRETYNAKFSQLTERQKEVVRELRKFHQ